MAAVAVEELVHPPVAPRRRFATVLLGNRKFVLGSVVFLALAVAALVGGLLVDPADRRTGAFPARQAPSAEAILGTT